MFSKVSQRESADASTRDTREEEQRSRLVLPAPKDVLDFCIKRVREERRSRESTWAAVLDGHPRFIECTGGFFRFDKLTSPLREEIMQGFE